MLDDTIRVVLVGALMRHGMRDGDRGLSVRVDPTFADVSLLTLNPALEVPHVRGSRVFGYALKEQEKGA